MWVSATGVVLAGAVVVDENPGGVGDVDVSGGVEHLEALAPETGVDHLGPPVRGALARSFNSAATYSTRRATIWNRFDTRALSGRTVRSR
jgi:hypothetical protein